MPKALKNVNDILRQKDRKNSSAYLVAKSLRGVVYNNCLGQVPAQNRQVFDVVAIDTNTVLPKKSIPRQGNKLILSV